MKKTNLLVVAWGLAGLLVVAAGLISLGQQDDEANPESQSFGPSGVSAFADLLRKNGYNVAIDLSSKPKLGKDDVAVAFRVVGKSSDMLGLMKESPEDQFLTGFWDRIHGGGTGILLPVAKDYLQASRAAQNAGYLPPGGGSDRPMSTSPGQPDAAYAEVKDLGTNTTFRVSNSGQTASSATASVPGGPGYSSLGSKGQNDDGATPKSAPERAVSMELWAADDQPFLVGYRYGKGTALVVSDGIGITNRFIDKYDNAQAYSTLIGIVAKGHKRIVFTEASFGNVSEPSLMETIGPWANAAWQQLLVLGLVVVFTLGKRFGVPEETRSVQRGARDLVDAVADTFRRAQSSQFALQTALASADSDLRLVLKLPRDATRTERDRLIPVPLQNALARLQVASEHPSVTQGQALELITMAQTELEEFIGPNQTKLRSLAKLKS